MFLLVNSVKFKLQPLLGWSVLFSLNVLQLKKLAKCESSSRSNGTIIHKNGK